MILKTKRLLLRPWQERDILPFIHMNQDPKVMQYFPSPLTEEESRHWAQKIRLHLQEKGWGLFAVELPRVAPFIGYIGIQETPFQAPFTPMIEIEWRLASRHWGKGYAPEGARAVLEYGFTTLELPQIVSYTALNNIKSQTVMKKLGMHRDPKDDFDRPTLQEGHPLRRHVLYRLKREEWSLIQQKKKVA